MTTQRWIDAGIRAGHDKNASILCPSCQKVPLKIWDVAASHDEAQFERIILCENCGAYNALRMRDTSHC